MLSSAAHPGRGPKRTGHPQNFRAAMHAAIERNSWRLPPEDIVQVADPRSKKAQDLVYSGASDGRNWKSVVFSLVVISLVITGIVTAINTIGYVDELLYWSGSRMTLEEYLQGDLCPEKLTPSWVSHAQFVFHADDGGLSVYDIRNNSITQLVTNHTMRQLNVKWFECSYDLRYILLRHNVKQIFKNTYTAHYTIYDVTNDHHIPVRLSDSSKMQQTLLQLAHWCGNTTTLVFVSENDIYLRYSPVSSTDHRVTYTGQQSMIYNGIPDWLYQEDVLTPPHEALWCSPDGSHIMFASFNDSEVRSFSFPWFGMDGIITPEPGAPFPASRTVRYPTPGTSNPKVKLFIASVNNTAIAHKEVRPPEVFEDTDYYLTSAGWVNHGNQQVAAVWMNRPQNLSVISNCQAPNWMCVETHAERAADDSWLDVQPHPVFSKDGDSFLLLAAVREGDQDRFTHIKHITLTQQHTAVITHGRYEVTRILAWDFVNHNVYFLGTQESKPGQRHLYVVRDPATDDPIRPVEPQCLTCDLRIFLRSSKEHYKNCSHFTAFLDPLPPYEKDGLTHYVLICEGPGIPLGSVHLTTNHSMVKTLFSMKEYCETKMKKLALPKPKTFEVPLPQKYKAQVQLLMPPSWRVELRDAAYPILVEVNGRPGSNSVTEKFSVDWGMYMSSKNDVVYVKLDVRGSKGQGKLSRKLGGIEVQDQITVLRFLLDNSDLSKYLDRTRVAVWGWGYGGYVTSMVLGSQQKYFKCGIAISPIADWMYYNSAFTERVLGYPSENFKLYVESDATQRSKNIPSHSLYLIHGLADITAPYQHSISLARSLAEEGIMFRYQSYADQGHELTGVLEHAYRSMEDYLRQCLTLDSDEQL